MSARVRISHLAGSITSQRHFVARYRPEIVAAKDWGPRIRMGCSFAAFLRFARALAAELGAERDIEPKLTLYGSGDFHHVSLALAARQAVRFNLVVIDNHPDWMRGVPILHCG